MSLLKGFAARMRSLFASGASEARMEEEFRFHLTMETERLVALGLPADEAKRRAFVAFGGVDQHREAMRDGRGTRLLGDFLSDVRYALRAMRRSPGFALAVAVTLGVGIGVNGIVFGFVNTVLFRPIPAGNADELVGVFTVDTKTGTAGLLAYQDFVDFRDRSGAFAGLAGETGVPLNLVGGTDGSSGSADMVWGGMVTENFFSVLAMRPVIGRLFAENDAPRGGNAFAVLSYESWKQRFHGDSSVVGRVVRLNGAEFTITGVAPAGFRGLRTFGFWPEMWVPVGMHNVIMPGSTNLLEQRGDGWIYGVGRMHPGWTMQRTQRAAGLFASQLAASYPATNATVGVTLLPGASGFDHPAFVKPRVLVLASTMGLFASIVTLLIICANLANMQLARAAARTHEIAIRLSLGCSRGRLARQLLAEALVLAIPGAVLATFVVRLGPWLEQFMMPHLQFRVGLGATSDYRVALFTAGVAILAVGLFGLAPALRASRPTLAPSAANVIGARARGARPRSLMRGLLVVCSWPCRWCSSSAAHSSSAVSSSLAGWMSVSIPRTVCCCRSMSGSRATTPHAVAVSTTRCSPERVLFQASSRRPGHSPFHSTRMAAASGSTSKARKPTPRTARSEPTPVLCPMASSRRSVFAFRKDASSPRVIRRAPPALCW
jgi:hypothetical protein